MKIRSMFPISVLLVLLACPSAAAERPAPEVMSLDECVLYSINNSYEVRLARLDLLVAETGILFSEAVWDTYVFGAAGYTEDKRQQLSVFSPDDNQTNTYLVGARKTLPTGTMLAAQWSDTRVWSNSDFISKNPSHNAELDLELIQPLLRNAMGFVDRGKYTLTALAVKNADLEMRDRIEQLVTDTIKAYIDVLSARELMKNTVEILRRAEELYEQEKKNFDLGLRELGDLYATEANVANRRAEVISAENVYSRTKDILKLLMNAPEEMDIEPGEKLETVRLDRSLGDYLKEAFEYRRDYKIRERSVDIKGLDLRLKGNEMWPELDLTMSMAMNGLENKFAEAAGKSFVNDNTEYFAGLEFSFPLENSAARSEYRKAGYEKEKALVSLKETERRIVTEVTIAYNDVLAFGKSMEYSGKAVELNEKKLAEEEKRFRYGRSTTKRIIDYQSDLLRAQIQDIRFTADHRKAKVDLFRSINVILDRYEVAL